MDESELRSLIAEGEHEGIDFKRELHLRTKPDKAEFVKDIISIANSAPNNSGYLIVGVDDDGTVVGTNRLDEGQIRSTVDTYIQPSIVLRCLYVPVQVPGCPLVEAIEIEGMDRPYKVARDLEQAKAGRSRLWERFLLRAGDVLISSGLWLKSRRQANSAPSVIEAGLSQPS
jgi:hypothetical protein